MHCERFENGTKTSRGLLERRTVKRTSMEDNVLRDAVTRINALAEEGQRLLSSLRQEQHISTSTYPAVSSSAGTRAANSTSRVLQQTSLTSSLRTLFPTFRNGSGGSTPQRHGPASTFSAAAGSRR